MPSLAISGDFSDDDEEEVAVEVEVEVSVKEKTGAVVHERERQQSFSSSNSCPSPAPSLPGVFVVERLAWPRRLIQLPLLALVSLGFLPFLQGCLYTIGYRIGRRMIQTYLK